MNKVRCSWAKGELDIAYHDTEWGRKTHDERELFEYLILEGMQAGEWKPTTTPVESLYLNIF